MATVLPSLLWSISVSGSAFIPTEMWLIVPVFALNLNVWPFPGITANLKGPIRTIMPYKTSNMEAAVVEEATWGLWFSWCPFRSCSLSCLPVPETGTQDLWFASPMPAGGSLLPTPYLHMWGLSGPAGAGCAHRRGTEVAGVHPTIPLALGVEFWRVINNWLNVPIGSQLESWRGAWSGK